MKILNITLCNFKNFRGENRIDFTSNGVGRNIILIGGVNGSGKTTIFESIKLCMFGRRFNSSLSKKDYEDYIVSSKNKSSAKDGDKRFFIQMEIEIDDTYPIYSITLRREWKISDGKVIQENFTILRDGMSLEIVPREYWEDYVISLVPPYISDYFFFDGERIKELATGDTAEETLRESIRDLIGLKLYETLVLDVETLINKIRLRNINQTDLQKSIKEKEREISEIDNEINRIEAEISVKSRKISELNNRREKVEKSLRRRAGTIARERKNIETKLLKLREELDAINNEIIQVCEVLPFIIASDVCRDVLKQLNKEKKIKELIVSKNTMEEVNKNLFKRLSVRNFTNKQLKIIREEITDIFSEMFGELKEGVQLFIHDLTNAEVENIENFLNNAETRLKTKFNKILKRREEIFLQSKKLNDELKRVPKESFVKEYIEDLATIRASIEFLEKDINSLRDEKWLLYEKKAKLEAVIRELEEKIICTEEDQRKINACIGIRDSLKEFIEVTISSKIKELEKIITEMYRKLANKNDMVKEIKIDTKTFMTTLIDFEGCVVNKESLSAGEKEIYALSVLWGLSKISKRRLPLIVDSLLARLDSSHIENIVENFFPNAGEQVIILSHDREIDQGLYDKLKPNVCKSYTLSLNENNKIKKGYFFD